jgi:hypothetical protein
MRAESSAKPKLGEWVEVLTEILKKEAKLPKRQRRSTQQLFRGSAWARIWRRARRRCAPPHQLGYVAIGIEKAWGGKQVATAKSTGLPITGPTASIPLTKDELLRGHLQFHVPITRDFALATDIFHDFNRVGGLRENIGVELRFLKLFLPPLPSKWERQFQYGRIRSGTFGGAYPVQEEYYCARSLTGPDRRAPLIPFKIS